MTVTDNRVITIENPEDAYYVAQEARKLASELGFSDFDIGMITIAVAEIATNVVRYALPGIANIKRLAVNIGIEITIDDHGTGIANLEEAMVDGFSTHCEPSIGKGLGSANRCVEEFIVNKTDSTGTSITLRHYLPLLEKNIEMLGISFPAVGLDDNGDQYFLKPYQADKLFVCLIDGAGKGAKAAASSKYTLDIVKKHYLDSFEDIIKHCHLKLKKHFPDRPVQMALLRVTTDSLEFCAVGDVGIKVIADTKTSFPVNDGSIGLTLPKKIHVYTTSKRASCQLYNQTASASDDATLVVIRDK